MSAPGIVTRILSNLTEVSSARARTRQASLDRYRCIRCGDQGPVGLVAQDSPIALCTSCREHLEAADGFLWFGTLVAHARRVVSQAKEDGS